jgi:hypothetical protein
MKTYTILGIMLVTGKDKDKVEKLAAGTHFLTAYGDKRGGKRKAKTPEQTHEILQKVQGGALTAGQQMWAETEEKSVYGAPLAQPTEMQGLSGRIEEPKDEAQEALNREIDREFDEACDQALENMEREAEGQETTDWRDEPNPILDGVPHEDPKCGNLKVCPKDMKYSSYCYKDCEHRGTEDSHVSD